MIHLAASGGPKFFLALRGQLCQKIHVYENNTKMVSDRHYGCPMVLAMVENEMINKYKYMCIYIQIYSNILHTYT